MLNVGSAFQVRHESVVWVLS